MGQTGGSFVPGNMSGDGLLYQLDGAKYLGGFPIAATNTPEMVSSSSAADALAMDFREQITNAIQEAIAKNITKAAEFH